MKGDLREEEALPSGPTGWGSPRPSGLRDQPHATESRRNTAVPPHGMTHMDMTPSRCYAGLPSGLVPIPRAALSTLEEGLSSTANK